MTKRRAVKMPERTDLIYELGEGKGKIIVGTVVKVAGERGSRYQFVSAKIDEATGEVQWVTVYGGKRGAQGNYFMARAFAADRIIKAPKSEQNWFGRTEEEGD